MAVIPHPSSPTNSNHVLLTDFQTNSHILRQDHQDWLDRTAVPALTATNPSWVFVRGFASRLGENDHNSELSNRRAHAVVRYLLENPAVDPDRITGIDARGEEWSGGAERDDSPRWRSVEVNLTKARQHARRQITPPTQHVQRIVLRRWLSDPSHGGALSGIDTGADRHAEQLNRLGRSLARHFNPDSAETTPVRRSVPVNYRINGIRVTQETETSDGVMPTVSMDTYNVAYEWGPPQPRVTLQEYGNPPRSITRAEARSWIEEPGSHLF